VLKAVEVVPKVVEIVLKVGEVVIDDLPKVLRGCAEGGGGCSGSRVEGAWRLCRMW